MPERILMSTDAVGGVLTYALNLGAELLARGHEVHLATMGPAMRPLQRARARAIPGLVLHESTYALEWMDDPWDGVAAAGVFLRDLAARIQPTVVHLNGFAHGGLDLGAPVVVVAHSCVLSWWEAVKGSPPPPAYDRYRTVVETGLRGASRVVAISGAMGAALRRHYRFDDAVVVPNGAPPAPSRSFVKEPFVLACGRVWDEAKNVAALARVAPRLSWPVKIAGWDASGPLSLGWLDPISIGRWMERAAIFALPVRYEPFGLSALEAALRGAALVLGDIPSQREIWGDDAIFVDGDEALADALERLAHDERFRHEMGARAERRALRYGVDRQADEMVALYGELTQGSARACA